MELKGLDGTLWTHSWTITASFSSAVCVFHVLRVGVEGFSGSPPQPGGVGVHVWFFLKHGLSLGVLSWAPNRSVYPFSHLLDHQLTKLHISAFHSTKLSSINFNGD